MNSEKIWLSPPHQTGKELTFIQEALANNWLAPSGEQSLLFEKALTEYNRIKHSVLLSSGTASIHLALKALGVGANDIVLCQSLTFVGSINPVTYLGALPVLIDSEMESWNICPDALEQAILYYRNKNKLPKAIIAVDLYGNPAQWKILKALSEQYDIPLVEDAAEALGSTYHTQKAGTLGDIGIFSFNGNKIITTSGGGALMTNITAIAEKVRFWSAQSREKTTHYEHTETGYNYQLSNICAAIGRAQLENINSRVESKRQLFRWYQQLFQNYVGFQPELKNANSNRWLSVIQFQNGNLSDKTNLESAFQTADIETRPVWKPMHLQPLFSSCPYFGGNTAEVLYKNGLCLPSGTGMNEAALTRIERVIKKCLG